MTDNIYISYAITEEIKRKIAYSASSSLANDVYFKMTVIDLFINSFGKDKILELLEQEDSIILKQIASSWDSFISKFNKIISNSSIAKLSQDTLKDKTLRETNSSSYKRFVKDMKKIDTIRPKITALYIFLIENSAIRNTTIPREYFKVLESSNYKIVPEDKKRKVGDFPDATSK